MLPVYLNYAMRLRLPRLSSFLSKSNSVTFLKIYKVKEKLSISVWMAHADTSNLFKNSSKDTESSSSTPLKKCLTMEPNTTR